MEEEMRKIEEEFAFQEKWYFSILEAHKIPGSKSSSEIEAVTFISFLQTCKWIFILCRENRGNIMIPLERTIKRDFYHDEMYHFKTSKELDKKYLPQFQMLLKSNFYFITDEFIYSNHLQRLFHYFKRQTIRCRKLDTENGFCAPEAIPFFKPKTVHLKDLLKPLPDDFILPHFVKDFTVDFYRVDPEVLYSTLERFGWISASFMVQITETEQIDSGKFLPILLEVIKKRNAYNELTFLSYRDIENREFSLDYPCEEMFINSFANRAIISQIFVKSILGVTVIMIKRRSRHNLCGSEFVSISFCETVLDLKKLFNSSRYQNNIRGTIESEEGADQKRREVISRFFYNGCEAEKEKDMSQQETDFSQVAHKFLKFEKYSPPTPDPAPELVEFLKEFEDFDIQPEKLAPHKPKWKKTEKLPDLPRKLPEIHSNNWLIEAKEVIKLRKFWMDFLQKGKFILELLPHKNVLDIAKKMKVTACTNFLRTSKWIHELLKSKRLDNEEWRNHGGTVAISSYQGFDKPEDFEKHLSSLRFFYLNCLRFEYFKDKKQIILDDIQQLGQIKLLQSLIGGRLDVLIKAYRRGSFNEGLSECFKNLKAKKCSNNVTIRTDYQRNVYAVEIFALSGISESVFIFRSMARGRVGQWNYFIRMESAGEGAVGVALFDFEREEAFVDVKCEYFPTMGSFLDYFEREVGSKRRARDWMQLREKDETIEPREEDFGIYNGITSPYIHFNEQKEADDLKEVRRRFFS